MMGCISVETTYTYAAICDEQRCSHGLVGGRMRAETISGESYDDCKRQLEQVGWRIGSATLRFPSPTTICPRCTEARALAVRSHLDRQKDQPE